MTQKTKVILTPKNLKIIREKLETEWPKCSIYFFNSKGQPNNDGWRYIELWSRRKGFIAREKFRCIICELNHSHKICPGCNMPTTID